jgi:pyruvate dehydrogenase E2 component (dihydrolipoamide acetyltransferase)
LKEDLLRDLKSFDTKGEEVKPCSEPVRKQLTGMRKVIAERMLKSHLEIPPVTLNAKADVTELVALRKQINDTPDIKISINDLLLKAAAVALSESPDINASIKDNEIIYKLDINIGMAVALEDGLIVPVIKNADKLSLRQISIKAKELAAKAREGKLKPDEYSGGTFTVSNMGMYGIVSFTPIINQPEIAILGVCAIENELKMVEGKIENRSVMGLSLTFDHRVVDGSQSAIFLSKIKSLLENPLRIIV